MRIYAFVEGYPSAYKPYYDAQFADLARRGHELRIFALGPGDGVLGDKLIQTGLADSIRYYLPDEVRQVPGFAPAIAAAFLRNPVARSRRAATLIRRRGSVRQRIMAAARMATLPVEPPDLCLVHGVGPMSGLTWIRGAYRASKIMFFYHGEKPADAGQLDAVAHGRAFAAADWILTNTAFARAKCISFGASQASVIISPVGFDLDDYPVPLTRSYRPEGVLRCISIGRLTEGKGIMTAVRALARLAAAGKRNFHYTVVGDGPMREPLEALVAHANLESEVTFHGTLPNRKVRALLRAADVLLLPSVAEKGWEETQGAVVQEAFLSGALAITSRTGGVPESIPEALRGLSVPPGDEAALEAAIRRVQALPEPEFRALAGDARSWARERYDIAILNDRMLRLLDRADGAAPAVPSARPA